MLEGVGQRTQRISVAHGSLGVDVPAVTVLLRQHRGANVTSFLSLVAEADTKLVCLLA